MKMKSVQKQTQLIKIHIPLKLQLRRFDLFGLLLLVLIFKTAPTNGHSFNEDSGSMLRTRVVSTRYGKMQGVIKSMDRHKYLKPVEVFLGVPYATPPIGSNRFAPTRAPAPWDEIKFMDQPGPVCPQRLPDISNETVALQKMPKGRLEYLRRLLPTLSNQSEDCLYMNIYAPVQVGVESKHPVILIIHGESYEWNSGNSYDGTVLASYAGLVVVTINYRLGILGFLNANPNPFSKARVANYGLMDQIAALHWVQQNIELFGGDPSKVTLLGHGPGAACINFLMTSPAVVPGLFHRTILLSGSALSPWALVEDPVHYSVELAKQTNCTIPQDMEENHEDIVDCLRNLPLNEIVNAHTETPRYLSSFGPSVDGVVVKTDYANEILTDLHSQSEYSATKGNKTDKQNSKSSTMKVDSQKRYDCMFGVVTAESLWQFSTHDIQNGFEGDHRDKIIRTFVRNAYTYHLNEIFYTIVNEYTDWERTVQHPINTRDSTVQALSDAEFVAPLVKMAEMLSSTRSTSANAAKSFFYVFDYQTKDGDYPQQRMGSVHGEELPYLLGAPVVDGLPHFPRNYTRSEVAISEALMLYIANFARTGNPNDHHKQEANFPISRERNKFRSIVWEEFDTMHHKYLEIGLKPRVKNHYRAHQLSVWLRLIPKIHQAGMANVFTKHNLFNDHNDNELYEGSVRPSLSRSNHARRQNQSNMNQFSKVLGDATTTYQSLVSACISIVATKPSYVRPNISVGNEMTDFEAASYTAYSTALSVTIAIGCSLLILNVLIFAGVFYQKDKKRMSAKKLHEKMNEPDVTASRLPNYFVTDSVDSERGDKYTKCNVDLTLTESTQKNTQLNSLKKSNLVNSKYCNGATLPKKLAFNFQNHTETQNQNIYLTLPASTTIMNVNQNKLQTRGVLSKDESAALYRSGSPQGSMSGAYQMSAQTKQKQRGRVPQNSLSEMNL